MELYPFVKFKNGADAFGGVWLVVETFGSTTVAEQAQGRHYRLLSLFEVHEIEFAKSHGFLNLLGISGVVGGVCCIRVCAIDVIDCG